MTTTKKEIFENLDNSIVDIADTMKIVEEWRAKAKIAQQNGDKKAEHAALDTIIQMFSPKYDLMWELADHLYFKELDKYLKRASSKTLNSLIDKQKK